MIRKNIFKILQVTLALMLISSALPLHGQTRKPVQRRAPQKKSAPAPAPKQEEVKLPPMDSAYSMSFEYFENGLSVFNSRGRVFKNAGNSSSDSLGNFAFVYNEKGRVFVNINGKRFGPYDAVNGKSATAAHPVKICQGGKFAFTYTLKGKDYINLNGRIEGPFTAIDHQSVSIASDGRYSYGYLQNKSNRYVNINGKKFGPFPNSGSLPTGVQEDGTFFYELTDKEGNYLININDKVLNLENAEFLSGEPGRIFTFKENGNWFVSDSDTVRGPYIEIQLLNIDKTGKGLSYKFRDSLSYGWYLYDRGDVSGPYNSIDLFGNTLFHGDIPVFKYSKEDGQYVSVGGKVSGPYNYTKRFAITDAGNYIFAYEKRNRWYINLRGETLRGSYGLIDDVAITKNGNYSFSHRDKNNANRSKLTVNNKVIDQEEGYIDEIFLTREGKILSIINNMGKMYVDAFGVRLGPFPYVESVNATERGDYYIVATDRQNSRKLVIINGKSFGEFDQIVEPLLGKDGRYLFTGQKNGEHFIYKNGETYGPYQSLSRFTPTPDWIKGNIITY